MHLYVTGKDVEYHAYVVAGERQLLVSRSVWFPENSPAVGSHLDVVTGIEVWSATPPPLGIRLPL